MSRLFDGIGNALAQGWDTLQSYGKIPERADNIAEQTFGQSSARDSSVKNAFRHALGTGMLTQAFGGGPIGALAAKLAGYGWEGIGMASPENRGNPAYRMDTLHDLNANAIGARVAQQASNQQELIDALKQMAMNAPVVDPPGVFSASPGYLTRSVR